MSFSTDPFLINQITDGSQAGWNGEISLAAMPGGGFAAYWINDPQAGVYGGSLTSGAIKARIFSKVGSSYIPATDEFTVGANVSGNHNFVEVDQTPNGDMLAVFTVVDGANTYLMGEVIGSDGAVVVPGFTISNAAYSYSKPKVAWLDNGSAVVVWTQDDTTTTTAGDRRAVSQVIPASSLSREGMTNHAPTGSAVMLSQVGSATTRALNSSDITDPTTQFYWDPANGGNGHIYQFVRDNVEGYTFERARDLAASAKISGVFGYLGTITDSNEAAFIHLHYPSDSYWLGGSDAAVEGEWRWITGPETGQLIAYTNWGGAEPNNMGGENYLMIAAWLEGRWNDLAGTLTSHYVVEYSDPVPSGSPSVTASGSAFTQGRTLYADASQISDPDGLGSISWLWQRSSDNGSTWSDINGATQSTYTLAQSDVGKLIRTKASYVDGAGTQETVFSAASTAIAGSGAQLGSTFNGTAGVDTLNGTADNEVYNGLGGIDSMDGAGGSDIYIITGSAEHKAAEITDTGASGTDEVRFSAAKSDTLKIFAGDTGIERVVIGTGTSALADSSGILSLNIDASKAVNGLTIIGNAGVNKLTGTAFNDMIDGGVGADKLTGGAGNDTYFVDNLKDGISEKATGGTDTVMASTGYTLASNVEHLTLTGSANIGGTGNKLNNTIIGNDGNNMLFGGLGNDTISGGAGADTFVFNTKPNAATNVDTITDFSSSDGDHLQFSLKLFKALGAVGDLTADQFWSGAGVTTAHDATDRLIYNTTSGDLYYDVDGTGAKAAVLVAHLSGSPALSYADIQIIA